MTNLEKQLKRLENAANKGISHMDSPELNGQQEAAYFDVTVTRLTANIASKLPFVVFGAGTLESGLQQDIGTYLNNGTTLVAIQYGNVFVSTTGATMTQDLTESDKLRLQYKLGANLDIIEITCNTVDYPQFVVSTLSDLFSLSKIRMSLSDSTQEAQFNESLNFSKRSIFGKQLNNPLSPNTFKTPSQFQTGIIDIDINDNVNKETAIWGKIIAVENFSVNLSVFVSRFSKLSM